MATQSIYKQKQVDSLKFEVQNLKSLEKYKVDTCVFPTDYVFKLVGINKPDYLLLQMMENPEDDFKCAKYLYNAYSTLTPLQASDERFWVYLAHVDLYKYMRARWKPENVLIRQRPDGTFPSQEEAESNYILDYWMGPLIRQGLSSLWWSVYLSIDPDREDPFELTEYLFKHYDFRTRRFTSSLFARNREGMIGLLEGMKSLDTYNTNFEARSNFAIMYFNSLGGTRQLSALDREFFKSELIRIDQEVRKYYTRDDIKKNKDHLFDDIGGLSSNSGNHLIDFSYTEDLTQKAAEEIVNDSSHDIQNITKEKTWTVLDDVLLRTLHSIYPIADLKKLLKRSEEDINKRMKYHGYVKNES